MKMDINEKIKTVGDVRYFEKTKDCDVKSNIEFVEKTMGCLPEFEVLNFTEKYGFSMFNNHVYIKSIEGNNFIKDRKIEIGKIYGFGNGKDSVKKIINIYYIEEQMNFKFYPLFEGYPGDIIYYSLEKETLGKILYWHHESELNEHDIIIAETFFEFMDKIYFENNEKETIEELTEEELKKINEKRERFGLPKIDRYKNIINKK